MSLTTVTDPVEQWEEDFHVEFVNENLFSPYMGPSEAEIIQVNQLLEGKPGDTVRFQLLTRLTGPGVRGDARLRDNEESVNNYVHPVEVDQIRNGVKIGEMEQQRTFINMLKAGKKLLKFWAAETLRDDIIARMDSPVVDGVTAYGDSSVAQRNAWLTANTDRVLYGALVSNASSSVHATALALIDSTDDTMSPNIVDLSYRRLLTASPNIRPYMGKGGEKWFVFFMGSLSFRDFKNHSTFQQAARDGWDRGKDNPLFKPGNLIWGGNIIVEIPEIGVKEDVGDSSIDVQANFHCGAQDVLLCWAARTKAIDDDDDYKNLMGVGVKEIRGVERASYNDKMHGQQTVFTAAVADA